MKKFIKAGLMQYSAMAGAGVFALPYVLHTSNFIYSWVGLILIAVVMIFVNKFYLDIIFHIKSVHQLPGYIGKLLGKPFEIITFLAMFCSFFGAMLVYIKIGSGLVQDILNINEWVSLGGYLFLVIGSYLFLKKEKKAILVYLPFLTMILFSIVFLLGVGSGNEIETETAFSFDFIGPCVFALTGFLILPDLANEFKFQPHRRLSAFLSSIVGVVVALIAYYFFSFGIITLANGGVSENSVDGLSGWLKIIVSILGILITFRSSQNFLNLFREIFDNDFKFDKKVSFLLPVLVPIISLLFIKISFVSIMSWVGVGSMFVLALMIGLARMKIRPTFWIMLGLFFIVTVFSLGIWSLL